MSSDNQVIDILTDKEILIAEYQAAQGSAQHHDQLVWAITSILWGSSLVLLGFVLGMLGRPDLRLPITFVVINAIVLTIYLWKCVRQLRDVKIHKYRRCIAIEEQLGMQQHRTLQYSAGEQTRGYSIVMSLFLALWFVSVALVWAP